MRWKETRRGQGMLEFALAIPVFLLLVLGIIEFGRMFLMYTSLFAAAREGARYGAAVETLCDHAGLQDAARRVGFFAGDMNIAIQYDDGYGTTKECEATVLGDRVHVTATIYFRSITGVIPQIPLRSIARRTIIKQVFLEWTLAPTSANAGAIPPTATFGPPPNTPTPTHTIDPNIPPTETGTPTNTPTITPTPLPPECEGEWDVGSTVSTIYYDLAFTNPNTYIMQLTVVSIGWNNDGGRLLDHIDFKPYGSTDFDRKWTGPSNTGQLTWYPDPPLFIPFGGESILRFVFKKTDVTVTNIDLTFSDGTNDCTLSYP